jgi:predicted ATP-grasp superfamily ATP-dependent carboligase
MDSNAVLIAAASGRALAASARRAGYAPLVADLFGDQDTLAAAAAHIRVEPVNGHGIGADALLAAFETLAEARHPCGAVCGTGFEDRPDLLERIAQRWGLVGNSAETVRRTKDPLSFARLCRDCGIPHPEVSLAPPADMTGWLAKRAGGSGGVHIRLTAGDRGPSFYFQRCVAGMPVSALFLADGRRAVVLGFSRQWSSPTPLRPFRYGGAAQPAGLGDDIERAMTAAIEQLGGAAALLGLNSADFLVDGSTFQLLEVNPRPGATVDIFEPPGGSLFAMHVAACRGTLPTAPPVYDEARAGAIVYVERSIAAMPDLPWPNWSADRPVAGSAVAAGGPLCSVFAGAPTAAAARTLVERRAAEIIAELNARRT